MKQFTQDSAKREVKSDKLRKKKHLFDENTNTGLVQFIFYVTG